MLMLLILGASLTIQSSVRAYVTGESEWSKGQKDAVFYLNQYAQSQSEVDFARYLNAIAIPLGDHQARLALDQTPPDIARAQAGFLQGNNHPDDIDGMIVLYLYFHQTPLMQKPIALWTQGDAMVTQMNTLAQVLKQQVSQGAPAAKIKAVLNRINALNIKVTPVEQAFSKALGETSRVINTSIYIVATALTLLLVGLGILLSRRMVKFNMLAIHEIKNSEQRFKTLLGASMDAVIEIDQEGIVTYWNRHAELVFGYSAQEALGVSLHVLIIPPIYNQAQLTGMQSFFNRVDGAALNKRLEVRVQRHNKEQFPAELVVSAYTFNQQEMFCAYIRDITEQKNHAAMLSEIAHYDTITNLPNRLLFQEHLAKVIAQAERSNLPLSLMFVDIDHFKDINDTHGHQIGDVLLRDVAKRMLKCLRQSDFLARFGGDEFVLVIHHVDANDQIDEVATRLLEVMKPPFLAQNETLYVTLSIGIASYPRHSTSYQALVQNADQAMYVVKKRGRNGFAHYDASMEEQVLLKRQLAHEMRVALKEEQFEVYYQPIVNLHTGEVSKCEALLRWHHPTKGTLAPSLFIAMAEESGLIGEIGQMVFYQALNAVARWRELFNPHFQVSINVSPVQLHQGTGHQWRKQLKMSPLLNGAIIVEITEGVLVNTSETVANTLLEYRDSGIQVALDDFGTGYSSLSYLTKFDIDYLKIDKSFLADLSRHTENTALYEAMMTMAHKLGMTVVAEGVETQAQLDLLQAMGCDYAQGYWFAKPLPKAEAEAFFKAHTKATQL